MRTEFGGAADSRCRDEKLANLRDRPEALSLWRRLPAESFDSITQQCVADCVARITSTVPEWRRAIAGDAAAASGLVLRLKAPDQIDARIDLAMSVLLRCAFDDAGAALVLSHALRKMPLGRKERARLATSWLVRNLSLARRVHARRSLIAKNPGEEPS